MNIFHIFYIFLRFLLFVFKRIINIFLKKEITKKNMINTLFQL